MKDGVVSFKGKDVLHFAPERSVTEVICRQNPKSYVTSSYPAGSDRSGELALNIEAIDRPDASYDSIICYHVLEHVDDRKALAELRRVLRRGGDLIIAVPIIEAWPATYENPSITEPRQRHLHFGQFDHVRYYGRDFRERIKDAGFELSEYMTDAEEVVRYGMRRGEILFIAS